MDDFGQDFGPTPEQLGEPPAPTFVTETDLAPPPETAMTVSSGGIPTGPTAIAAASPPLSIVTERDLAPGPSNTAGVRVNADGSSSGTGFASLVGTLSPLVKGAAPLLQKNPNSVQARAARALGFGGAPAPAQSSFGGPFLLIAVGAGILILGAVLTRKG
jgi:hypothetical protein